MNSATIEIERKNTELISVKVIMPVWFKTNKNGFTDIQIPLLGISTFVDNLSQLNDAVKEAVTGFCIIAEKHGKGLETQLKEAGWKLSDKTTLNLDSAGTPFESVMNTGMETSMDIHLPVAA